MLHKRNWKIFRIDKIVSILPSSMPHIPFNICERLDITYVKKKDDLTYVKVLKTSLPLLPDMSDTGCNYIARSLQGSLGA